MRNRPVLTPKAYVDAIKAAFRKRQGYVDVIDLFAIPDYSAFLVPFIDKKFSKYSKGKFTQLQWMFQAVDQSPDYITGVKILFRAFSSDKVFEIVEDVASLCNFKATNVNVRTYPAEECRPVRILKALPTAGLPAPEKLVEGSRVLVEEIARKTSAMVGQSHRDVITEWNEFLQEFPPSDDIREYVATNPMHIPFASVLFNVDPNTPLLPVSTDNLDSNSRIDSSRLPTFDALATVQYHGAPPDSRGTESRRAVATPTAAQVTQSNTAETGPVFGSNAMEVVEPTRATSSSSSSIHKPTKKRKSRPPSVPGPVRGSVRAAAEAAKKNLHEESEVSDGSSDDEGESDDEPDVEEMERKHDEDAIIQDEIDEKDEGRDNLASWERTCIFSKECDITARNRLLQKYKGKEFFDADENEVRFIADVEWSAGQWFVVTRQLDEAQYVAAGKHFKKTSFNYSINYNFVDMVNAATQQYMDGRRELFESEMLKLRVRQKSIRRFDIPARMKALVSKDDDISRMLLDDELNGLVFYDDDVNGDGSGESEMRVVVGVEVVMSSKSKLTENVVCTELYNDSLQESRLSYLDNQNYELYDINNDLLQMIDHRFDSKTKRQRRGH